MRHGAGKSLFGEPLGTEVGHEVPNFLTLEEEHLRTRQFAASYFTNRNHEPSSRRSDSYRNDEAPSYLQQAYGSQPRAPSRGHAQAESTAKDWTCSDGHNPSTLNSPFELFSTDLEIHSKRENGKKNIDSGKYTHFPPKRQGFRHEEIEVGPLRGASLQLMPGSIRRRTFTSP
jgi:hypothetical protein